MNSEEIKKDVEHKKKAIENKGKSITYEEFLKSMELFEGKGIPDKYSIYAYTVTNGKVYYRWNKYAQKHYIKNEGFNWNGVFDELPPIEYESSKVTTDETEKIDVKALSVDKDYVEHPITRDSGYLKPRFKFINMRLRRNRETKKDYKKALKLFGLNEDVSISPDKVVSIDNYKETLYSQLQRQVDKIQEINREIADVLKVFYYENERLILKGDASDYPEEEVKRRASDWKDFKNDMRHLFEVAIQRGLEAKHIKEHWLDNKIFSNDYADDHLKKATAFGIVTLAKKRDPILEIATNIARMIQPLESIQEDALLDAKIVTAEEYLRETEIEDEANSNADKLSVASEWMDSLMKKITDIEIVKYDSQKANNLVEETFINQYEDFKKDFDFAELDTPFVSGGTLTKISICKALKFLFELKHQPQTITADAIQRKYNRENYW